MSRDCTSPFQNSCTEFEINGCGLNTNYGFRNPHPLYFYGHFNKIKGSVNRRKKGTK
jgi:hypothetical protein